MNELEDILDELNQNEGASSLAISKAAEAMKTEFPRDYVAFLQKCNGGEGMIGENYLNLWQVEELAEMNKAYQVSDYAPGLLLIGSDGGGEAFGFDTRTVPWAVVKVPFVGLDLRDATVSASSFIDFLKSLVA